MKLKQASNFLKAVILSNFGVKTPLKVMHYVSYRCNFRCDYCYVKELSIEKEMTTEQAKKTMDSFKKMGTQVWTFIGGEPLLRQDIGELIAYAKKLGFTTNISTNGFFIKRKIHELEKIDNVFISLEGPPEVHDKICGKGSYSAVIEAIKELKRIKKTVILNSVLTIENYKHIDFMDKIAKKHKCYFNISPVYSLVEDAKKYQLNTGQLKTVFKKIKEIKRKNKYIACSNRAFKRTIKYSKGELKKYQNNCLAGKLYCTITPTGNIAPCYVLLKKRWPSSILLGPTKAFKALPDLSKCDCNTNCFYNLNELLSLSPAMLLESAYNVIRGRRIY